MNRRDRRIAKKRLRMEATAATMPRILAFVDAFKAAPNDADIEIRTGTFGNTAAILVSISSGGGDHAMTVTEGRMLAKIMEETMNKFPNDPEAATLPNLIMALRAGCDQAERHQ